MVMGLDSQQPTSIHMVTPCLPDRKSADKYLMIKLVCCLLWRRLTNVSALELLNSFFISTNSRDIYGTWHISRSVQIRHWRIILWRYNGYLIYQNMKKKSQHLLQSFFTFNSPYIQSMNSVIKIAIKIAPHFVINWTPFSLTLTLDFQGQILKMLYLRYGRANWHGMKGMWVDRMLHPLCDFQLWPQPWPWPLIFKFKFWKSRISGMGWPIDIEWKGCESMECWTHVVTFNIHLFHELDLGFSRSNFEKVVSQEWDG